MPLGVRGSGSCRAEVCKSTGAVSLREKSMLLSNLKLVLALCMLPVS